MERAEDGTDDQTVMMMELNDQDEDYGPKIHSECQLSGPSSKYLGFQDLGYPGFHFPLTPGTLS